MNRLSTPLLSILLLAVPAGATTVMRISLEKMTVSSDVVLHGKVMSSRALTVNGNARHIRTEVVIEITELLRGPDGMRQLTLSLAGGRVGDYAMRIPGMPSFTAGQEIVLFLEKTKTNWALTGLGQGKFTVFEAQGRKMVRRQLDGLHFVGYDGQGRFQNAPTPLRAPEQTLSGLLAEVRSILTAEKARAGSNRTGSNRAGSNRAGSNRAGSK